MDRRQEVSGQETGCKWTGGRRQEISEQEAGGKWTGDRR